MRFGETLTEGIVPEWKSRYIDYAEGKKLIKKLKKEAQKKTPRESGSTRQSASSPYSNFQLPLPALSNSNHPSPRSVAQSQSDQPKQQSHHQAHQQLSGPSPRHTPKSRSPLPVNERPQGKASPLTVRSPLMNRGEPVQNYTEPWDTPLTDGIRLTAMSRDSADIFFEWLNEQVRKAEEFYEEKEADLVKRGRMLESQMDNLQKHKKVAKQKRSETLAGQGASFAQRFDLPTLPGVLQGNADKHNHDGRNDFESKPHVNYPQAKHMLKNATFEYYQALQQLKGFRALNETAIRKIVKKFDKTFDTKFLDSYLDQMAQYPMQKSHELEKWTTRTENLYAKAFEDGNRKHAVERLQSSAAKTPHNSAVLVIGLMLGAGLPLFIQAIVNGIQELDGGAHEVEVRFLLQIWAGFLFITLMLLLFSINILVWTAYRINYVFIFELNRTNALDYRQYAVMPSIMFFGMSLFGWLTFSVDHPVLPNRYFPCIFMPIAVILFIMPINYFYWPARRWMMIALWRLFFSGWYPVEFRDFFMGDIFCSLNYSVSNTEFFFCLYSTKRWWERPDQAMLCSSAHSRVLGFLNCLPPIWRFLQCFRRFGDTLDWFPHLLNAGKYSCTILFNMFLGLARVEPDRTKWKVLFICFAALNSVYSSLWDILMDFSLSVNLRPELTYPRWTYYAIMVVDPILRFNWVLYAAFWSQRQQSYKISFLVALIEVFRRFLWVFFRVENEHASNVLRFRTFKDLDLPYCDHQHDQTPASAASRASQAGSGLTSMSDLPSPILPVAASPRPNQLKRQTTIGSIVNSPRFQGVSTMLQRAHTSDFQRRRSVVEDSDDDDPDDDDDDDDDAGQSATESATDNDEPPVSYRGPGSSRTSPA